MADSMTPTAAEAQPGIAESPQGGPPAGPAQPPAVWVSDGVIDAFAGSPARSEVSTPAPESTVSPAAEPAPAAKADVSPPPAQPQPEAVAPKPPDEATPQPTQLSESEVERRVQRALDQARRKWDRERTEAERQAAERARQEHETQVRTQAEQEEAALYQRWKGGDAEAEAQLVERYGSLLDRKYSQQQQDVQRQLVAERQAAERRLAEFASQKWAEHAQGFGVDPEDEEILAAPEAKEQGFKSLNRLLLKRTADDEVVAAMRENPRVQEWAEGLRTELQKEHTAEIERLKKEMDEAVAKARQASALDTQARLIGNGQVPDADLSSSSGGQPRSENEMLNRFITNPQDKEAADWYRRYRAAHY